MDHIDQHLATATIGNKYSFSIKAALAIGKKTLNQYYDKTDHSEVFRITMGMIFLCCFIILTVPLLVLHPHHKLKYFRNAGWEEEWVKRAEEIVHTVFDLSYGSSDTIWAAPQVNKVCVIQFQF